MTTNELRDLCDGVARKLLGLIGDQAIKFLANNGIGVTIFAFTFQPGAIAYISSANREDMVRSLKEFVAMQEAGLATEPRGERGQG